MKLLMYILLPIIMILSCLYLVMFSSDRYRYPCQDPANWHEDGCYPPECEADGTCTKYLLTPLVNQQLNKEQEGAVK